MDCPPAGWSGGVKHDDVVIAGAGIRGLSITRRQARRVIRMLNIKIHGHRDCLGFGRHMLERDGGYGAPLATADFCKHSDDGCELSVTLFPVDPGDAHTLN